MSKPRTFKSRTNKLLKLAQNEPHSVSNNNCFSNSKSHTLATKNVLNWLNNKSNVFEDKKLQFDVSSNPKTYSRKRLFNDLDKLNTTDSVDIGKNKKIVSNKKINILCEYNLNTTHFERSLYETEAQRDSTVLAEVLLSDSPEEKLSINQLLDRQENSGICKNENIISWSLSETEAQRDSTVLAEVLLSNSPEEKLSINQLLDRQENSGICNNENIISWSLSETEAQRDSTVLAEVLLSDRPEEKLSINQLLDRQENSGICKNENIISWSLSETEAQRDSTVLAEVLLSDSPEEKLSINQLLDRQENSGICKNENIISWSFSETEAQRDSTVLAEVLLSNSPEEKLSIRSLSETEVHQDSIVLTEVMICGSPKERYSIDQLPEPEKCENSGICYSENISWLLNYVNRSQSDDTIIDMDVSVENQRPFDFPESSIELNIIEPLEVNLLSPKIGPRFEISSEESENEKSPIKAKTNRTRKRMIHKKQWKQTIVKNLVSKGLQHTCWNGKIVDKKTIILENMCLESECSFKCHTNFSYNDFLKIFHVYYSLNRKDKLTFILNYTERIETKSDKNKVKKHKYSFRYYLKKGDLPKLRVCKKVFLTCICISQTSVYNAHNKKNMLSLTPPDERRGFNNKSRVPIDDKKFAINHISSYPTVASHYCRTDTQKKYLSSELNIMKMYSMYLESCLTESNIKPVSVHYYRHIFNTEFNLEFFAPKKDLCDLCEEFKVLKNSNRLTEEKKQFYEDHIIKKQEMRIENDEDRKNEDPTLAIISFDLENVITIPKTNVGSAFYKRKLNVYNMTAHLKMTTHTKIYCGLWHEGIVGRSGNDMASAVQAILTAICDQNPIISRIVTWSDSCIPQNRNSIMSTAMISFLLNRPNIDNIIMKFSTPGHSGIQLVDNAHSQIEKFLKKMEIWSTLTLYSALSKVNLKNPFELLILDKDCFKDYHKLAKFFKFNHIPFLSVSQLMFNQKSPECVGFKTTHTVLSFEYRDIILPKSPNINILRIPEVATSSKSLLTEEKKKDIMSLFKFMEQSDIEFYNELFQ